jgi:acetyl esterase/lipase
MALAPRSGPIHNTPHDEYGGHAMRRCNASSICLFTVLSLGAAACSGGTSGTSSGGHDSGGTTTTGSDASSTTTGGGSDASSGGGDDGGSTTTSGGDGGSTTTGSGDGGSTTDSGTSGGGDAIGTGGLPDPNVDGPYAYAELDATIATVSGGDSNVPVHCAYPKSGPTAGPYPVVVIAHGLSLKASYYLGYVQRLASFGYVALTVDFPSSPFSVNNATEVADVLAGIDWAKSDPTVGGIADLTKVGLTGHSLGGKLALLGATMDPRVKASIVLDPVDAGAFGSCTAPACYTVAPMLAALKIPTGFLGELTDSTGGFMPCAPAADNFTTFYAKANTPSFQVTVNGADHMEFLDSVSACGVTCSLCTAGTAKNADVNALAKAYVAAFYERNLRGIAGYDDYLTGAIANTRYVATGAVSIVSK